MELQMLARGAYRPAGRSDPIQFYHTPFIGRLYRNRLARCISLLPNGRRVLEIGYGSGVSFPNLSEKFDEIHGIDPHDHADEVKRLFASTGVDPHLRQGSVLQLPYEDDSFNAAISISLHEHLPADQQGKAFAEVRRVVRNGGCYVVGVPGVNTLMTTAFRLLSYPIHEFHLSSESCVLAAMRRTFDVDTTKYSPVLWPRSLTLYVRSRGWKR